MGLTESEREDGDRWIVLSDKQGIRRLGFQHGVHRQGGTHLDLDGNAFDLCAYR
jgi:hypothetical protein